MTCRVKYFKAGDLEIHLSIPGRKKETKKVSIQPKPISEPVGGTVNEPIHPENFKANELMSYDQILNWSGSPAQEPELPLTGELPLSETV